MEPTVHGLTVHFIQSQIVARRLQAEHCIDRFTVARSEREKNDSAFKFGRLELQAELLEFVLFLLESGELNREPRVECPAQ